MTRAEWKKRFGIARLLASRYDGEYGFNAKDEKLYMALPACVKVTAGKYRNGQHDLLVAVRDYRKMFATYNDKPYNTVKLTNHELNVKRRKAIRDAIRQKLAIYDDGYMPITY